MKLILLILFLLVTLNAGEKPLSELSLQIQPNVIENAPKTVNSWVLPNYTQKIEFKYIYGLLLFILILILIFLNRQQVLKKKNSELEALKDELLNLNQTLEDKVSEAVRDMQKKDAHLLHESRLSQMGEMMSMIAHQWKQPLSAIGTLQISMKMTIELEEYDLYDKAEQEKFLMFLNEKLDKIGLHTKNLSSIIADFSDFYRPKYHEETYLSDAVALAFKLIEDSISSENIDMCLELNSKKKVELFKNEFVQVILNIINNARDQIIINKIQDAQIFIKSYDRDELVILEISDNAGGIDKDIINRIFDPYFSTKFEKNGTGLGLHMSKNIINQHLDGKIYAKNVHNAQGDSIGAMFIIEIGGAKTDD